MNILIIINILIYITLFINVLNSKIILGLKIPIFTPIRFSKSFFEIFERKQFFI